MLEHNGLTDKLYIFVASEEEKELYVAALAGKPYRDIIIGELGITNATKAICNYFPVGQRIVFMDDDLERFFEFQKTSPDDNNLICIKDSNNLRQYIEDGFETIDKYDCGAFTASFQTNRVWLRNKPFKEIRPILLFGNFFGTRNNPELILTQWGHGEDVIRSAAYINKFGGMLVYCCIGFHTFYGKEPGGMQKSDRGSDTLATTSKASWEAYNSLDYLRAYATEPAKEKNLPFINSRIKRLPLIIKELRSRGITPKLMAWPDWGR
jgi:hypothetical protein